MAMETFRPRLGAVVSWILFWAVVAGGLAFLYLSTRHAKEKYGTDDQQMNVLAQDSLERTASASKDWPGWRGVQRDGIYDHPIKTDWPKEGPAVLWRQDVGPSYASVSIDRGRVFVFGKLRNDTKKETLQCLSEADGKELWRFDYEASYRIEYDNIPRSTPFVDGDLIYTVGGGGVMHCLEAAPGVGQPKTLWRRDLLKDFAAPLPRWGVAFSPLVVGDLVYVTPGGADDNSIAALDKRTGETRWKSQRDGSGYSSPIAGTLAGKSQLVCLTAQRLIGLELDTGKLLWQFPWVTDFDANCATPIRVRDFVFISSGYSHGSAVVRIEKTDVGLTASKVYVSRKMQNHFSSCVLWQDHLYGFDDARLACMKFRGEPDDSKPLKWSQGNLGKGSLIAAGGHLIVLGEMGQVALVEPNPEAYKEKAAFQFTTDKTWSAPALAQGRLYLRDSKQIMCYDLRP